MKWEKIADDGVAQGLLFDEILDNIRKEMGFFDSPKRNEVYDYLMENYERDKLFSNKFTVKKSLPLDRLGDKVKITNDLTQAVESVKMLQELYDNIKQQRVNPDDVQETFDDVEERIADSFNKLFNLLDAIEQSLNQM
jgi:hypothetical protein